LSDLVPQGGSRETGIMANGSVGLLRIVWCSALSVRIKPMDLPSMNKAERGLESAVGERGKVVRSTKTLYTI
jgi:hypothetical protein